MKALFLASTNQVNDFKFISINRAVKEHFKIQSDEIVGKNIVDLIHDFDGKVPDDIEDLQTIPGIGRKTANVIVSVAFNKPAFAVDTHVHRVSDRIGLTTNAKTPLATEEQLTKGFPREMWPIAHHWIILHGRYVCQARKPKCEECGLSAFCRYFQMQSKKK